MPTNAIANGGGPIASGQAVFVETFEIFTYRFPIYRDKIPINRDKRCWLIDEQQFIPALAITSPV
jgi:hypothetical protein